jgi:hypothetical protein
MCVSSVSSTLLLSPQPANHRVRRRLGSDVRGFSTDPRAHWIQTPNKSNAGINLIRLGRLIHQTNQLHALIGYLNFHTLGLNFYG